MLEKGIQDFDQIRNHIVYKLVNTDRNKALLEYVPHMEFLDLSILFHCLTEKEKECTISNLIHNAHFKQLGVSLNQLYEAASRNTQRILGYEIKNMRNVMCEIIKKNPGKYDHGECMTVLESSIPMYVLSNRNWVEMPKDFDGNLEMKHFETKGKCIDYIDEMHKEEEEKHCNGGYWYEKYLA